MSSSSKKIVKLVKKNAQLKLVKKHAQLGVKILEQSAAAKNGDKKAIKAVAKLTRKQAKVMQSIQRLHNSRK